MKNVAVKLIAGTMVLLLPCACTSVSQNETDAKTIQVDINQEASYGNFFEKEYKAIPLATSDSTLVGEIGKIQMTDSALYVFDEEQNTIFAFSLKGDFLQKYSHAGQGEGEYPYLSDFEVYDGHLYILSRFNKCIYQYTLDDRYIGKIELDDWFEGFRIIDNQRMWLYSDYNNKLLHNVILYNYPERKVMASYCPFEKNGSFSIEHQAFHEGSHKELLLTQLYDHTIYALNEDSIRKLCTLSFNTPEQITGNTRETSLYQLHQSQKKKSIIRTIENVTLKDSILYAAYIWKYRTHLARVNLKTGSSKSTICRIVDGYPFAFSVSLLWQGKAIGALHAETVINLSDTPFPSDKNPDGLLHEDDNPVIFIRELK